MQLAHLLTLLVTLAASASAKCSYRPQGLLIHGLKDECKDTHPGVFENAWICPYEHQRPDIELNSKDGTCSHVRSDSTKGMFIFCCDFVQYSPYWEKVKEELEKKKAKELGAGSPGTGKKQRRH